MRIALLVVALAGCSDRALPDVGAQPGFDLAVAPDLGCTLVPVPLTAIRVDDLNQCPLDLFRMTVQFSVDACQPVGPVLVRYDDLANSYTVTAQACSFPRCQPPPITVERTAILSEVARARPGQVLVLDGAPAGTLGTMVPMQKPLADGKCGTVNPTGCRSDVECEQSDATTRCWYDGGHCVRICQTDADCTGGKRCQLGLCL